MAGIVEEVPLDAPDLVVHLLPLRARVHVDLHLRELERPLTGLVRPFPRLGRLRGAAHEPLLALLVEDLLAVRGHDERGHVLQQLVRLPRLQDELLDGEGWGPVEAGDLRGLSKEELTLLAGGQRDVVAGRDGHGQNALVDLLEIDLDLDRLLRLLLVLAFVLLPLVLVRRPRPFLLGLLPLLLVALRGEGRRQVLLQHDDVDRARHRAVKAGHVAAGGEADVGAGGEVEVLAVWIEGGEEGVAHPVRHLGGLAGLDGGDEQGVEVAGQLLGVGQPLAVGRPDLVEGRLVEKVGVHLQGRPPGQVHVPEIEAFVRVGDLLGVGRPGGRIEERGRAPESDLLHLAQAVLVANVQRILAGFVREPGDGLPVRRPGGVAVGRGRGAGDVADVALLRGHGQDLPVRLEERALPRGRDVRAQDLLGFQLREVRARLGKVPCHPHVDDVVPAAREVDEVQRAELLVDDDPGPGGRSLDVQALVLDHLRHLPAAGVVREQAHGAASVGEEIDLVPDPHGVEVVRVLPRDLLQGEVGEVDDPDGLGLSAPVALPGRLPLEGGNVGQLRAVGREDAVVGHGQGHLGGEAPLHRNREELGGVRAARPMRREEDPLAVRGPAHRLVGVRVIRQPPRHSAGGRHQVDVRVAVVLPGERDRGAVGREEGPGLGSRAGGEALRLAPLARHHPEVAREGERDPGLAHRRPAQEQGPLAGAAGRAGGQENEQDGDEPSHDFRSSLGRDPERQAYVGPRPRAKSARAASCIMGTGPEGAA